MGNVRTAPLAVAGWALLLSVAVLLPAGCRKDDPAPSGGSTGTAGEQHQAPNYDGVIAEHKVVLAKDPHNLAALIGLGNALYDAGRWADAIVAYKEALQISPHNADLITDMGTCYRNLGMYDQAIAVYNQALTFEPAHQEALLNLGIVYGNDKGQYREAITAWDRLLHVAPKHPRADELRAAMKKFRTAERMHSR